MFWQKRLMQLFRKPSGEEVRTIRASTLAMYRWCSIKSWLAASGVESPPSEATEEGTLIHEAIDKARKLSPQEEEFKTFIDGLRKNERLYRPWIDPSVKIELGEITTSGMDDFRVDENRHVTLIEYKTKGSWKVDPTSLMPAIFQTQIYQWVLEPFLVLAGYYWRESHIVWLKRDRNGFTPIGETKVTEYNPTEVQNEIIKIFDEWNKAALAKTNEERRKILRPPKKFKCISCAEVFKSQCPFQNP